MCGDKDRRATNLQIHNECDSSTQRRTGAGPAHHGKGHTHIAVARHFMLSTPLCRKLSVLANKLV